MNDAGIQSLAHVNHKQHPYPLWDLTSLAELHWGRQTCPHTKSTLLLPLLSKIMLHTSAASCLFHLTSCVVVGRWKSERKTLDTSWNLLLLLLLLQSTNKSRENWSALRGNEKTDFTHQMFGQKNVTLQFALRGRSTASQQRWCLWGKVSYKDVF